jgi:hypothetical protein
MMTLFEIDEHNSPRENYAFRRHNPVQSLAGIVDVQKNRSRTS